MSITDDQRTILEQLARTGGDCLTAEQRKAATPLIREGLVAVDTTRGSQAYRLHWYTLTDLGKEHVA